LPIVATVGDQQSAIGNRQLAIINDDKQQGSGTEVET
jgi:hypothetical protein